MKASEISQEEKEKRAAVSTALLKAFSEVAFAQPERNIQVPIGELCILTGITKKRIWDLLSASDLITEDEAQLLTSVFSNAKHFELKTPPDFTEILYPSETKPAVAQRELVDGAFRRSYGPFKWPEEILRDDYNYHLKAEVDKAQLYILRRSNDGAAAYTLVSGHLMGWACQELAKYTGLSSRGINLYLDPRRAESLTIEDAAKLDNVFKSFYPNGVSPLKQLGIHGELRSTSHHDLPVTERGHVIAGVLQGLVREWGIKHLKKLTGVDMQEALEIDDIDLAGRNFLKHVSDEGFAKLNAAFGNRFVPGTLPERKVPDSEFLPLRKDLPKRKGGQTKIHYPVPLLDEQELQAPFASIGKRIKGLRTQHNRYLKLSEIEGISEHRVADIERGVPMTLEEADNFDAAFKSRHTISGGNGTIRALVEQAKAHFAAFPDRVVSAGEYPASSIEAGQDLPAADASTHHSARHARGPGSRIYPPVKPLSEEELAHPLISIGQRIKKLARTPNHYLAKDAIARHLGTDVARIDSIFAGAEITLQEADLLDKAFVASKAISGKDGTIRALVEQVQAHLLAVGFDKQNPADDLSPPAYVAPAEPAVAAPLSHQEPREPMLKLTSLEPTLAASPAGQATSLDPNPESSENSPAVKAAMDELKRMDKNTPTRALNIKMEKWAKQTGDRLKTLGVAHAFFAGRANFLRKIGSASDGVIEQLAEDNNLPLEDELGGMARRRIMELVLDPLRMNEEEAGQWDALLLRKAIIREGEPTVTDYVKAVKELKNKDSQRVFGSQNGAGAGFPGS